MNATPRLRKVISFPDPVIAFSNDGVTVVTARQNTNTTPLSAFAGNEQPVVRLWDAATGRPRGEPLPDLTLTPRITFSLDGSSSYWNPISWFTALRGGRAGTSLYPEQAGQ